MPESKRPQADPKRPLAIRTQAVAAMRSLSDMAQTALSPFNDDVKAAAAELIAGGIPPRSVADQLGIPVVSILMWSQSDEAFQATVEGYVKAAQIGVKLYAAEQGIDMIRALARDAVDPEVAPADRRASALEVLRHGGNAPPPPAPAGPTTIVQVDQRTIEAKQRMDDIYARARANMITADEDHE